MIRCGFLNIYFFYLVKIYIMKKFMNISINIFAENFAKDSSGKNAWLVLITVLALLR